MKLQKKRSQVETGGLNDQGHFSIRASAEAFQILSSGLYSDKILAIIRELSTNAWDAHVAAGCKDKPFLIKLPNKLDPSFKVRDYGTGLSHDDINYIYTTYFFSTKNDSNDFTGALGLGSKSPFSYAESFSVVSYYNGEKRAYAAFMDEQDLPAIALLSTEPTDEPNGLEVQFPVKDVDFRTFQDRARRVLKRFNPTPEIHGLNKNEGDITPVSYVIEGTDWGLTDRHLSSRPVALQGNIAYPLSWDSLAEHIKGPEKSLFRLPIELQFDIGDLEIAASREELGYKELTIDNIKAKLEVAYAELSKKIDVLFKDCKTLWDVKKAYSDLYAGDGNPLHGFANAIEYQPTFKGKKVEGRHFNYDLYRNDDLANVVLYSLANKWGEIKVHRYSAHTRNTQISIDPKDDPVIFLNDLKIGGQSRARYYMEENQVKRAFMVAVKDPAVFNMFVSDLAGATILLTSSLDKPKRQAANTVRTTSTISGYSWVRRHYYGSRDSWKNEIDLSLADGGIYVLLKNFEVIRDENNPDKFMDNSSFDSFVETIRSAGILSKDQKIYGFALGHSKKIREHKNWVSLTEFVSGSVRKEFSGIRKLQKLAEAKSLALLEDHSYRVHDMIRFYTQLSKGLTNQKNPITRFLTAYETAKTNTKTIDKSKLNLINKLSKFGCHILPESMKVKNDITVLYGNIKQEIPLLRLIEYNSETNDKEVNAHLVDYINALKF